MPKNTQTPTPTPTPETTSQVTSVIILPDDSNADVRQFGALLEEVRRQRATLAAQLVRGQDFTRVYELACRLDATVYRSFATMRHVSAHAMFDALTHAVETLLACDVDTPNYARAYNTALAVARHMVAVGPSTVSKDKEATAQLRAINAVLGAMHRVPVMAEYSAPDAYARLSAAADKRANGGKVASSNLAGVLTSAPEDANK